MPVDRRFRRNPAATLATLARDPRLRFTQSGKSLLVWFRSHLVSPDEHESLLELVPEHLAGRIAQLAREVAAEWISLANQLEDPVARQESLSAAPGTGKQAL